MKILFIIPFALTAFSGLSQTIATGCKAEDVVAQNTHVQNNLSAQITTNSYSNQQSKRQIVLDEISKDLKRQELQTTFRKKYQTDQKVTNPFINTDTSAVYYKTHGIKYKNTFETLKRMLRDGGRLKDAVYLVESTWSKNEATYQTFSEQIAKITNTVKQLLKEDGFSEKNKLACHYEIQRLFRDTIKTENNVLYPFTYDFEDYKGDEDYTKQFVTKLMHTKKGQCHSLPLLYAIVAEELNVPAYLSYSPSHSFIQFRNANGGLSYFETTNGYVTTRDWLMQSNYIRVESIISGIYLAPTSKRQQIASCLLDLANQYIAEFGYDEFVARCASVCLHYYPKSIGAYKLFSNYITSMFITEFNKLGNPKEIESYPSLNRKFELMESTYLKIDELGYSEMPESVYNTWLKSVEVAKTQRTNK